MDAKTIKREQFVNKLPSQFIEIINKDENTYQLKAGKEGEIDHLPSQLSRLEPDMKKGEFESLLKINENEEEEYEFPWQELINENENEEEQFAHLEENPNELEHLEYIESLGKYLQDEKEIYYDEEKETISSMDTFHEWLASLREDAPSLPTQIHGSLFLQN